LKDKVIEELHRIREENYEKQGFSLEERLTRVNQGGEEFQKLVDKAR
jgi:hypothetical protein